jgi:Short C-terminal domain/Phospholipase_D-nuclease N-terminal
MMVAASLGDFLWTLLVIFFMFIYFVLLFQVIGDLFRRGEISGWKKAAWVLFLIVAPFLGLFVYFIINSQGMAERNVSAAQQSREQFDSYVRSVASDEGPAGQIAKAKELLDAGTITQEEFDAIKAKALS